MLQLSHSSYPPTRNSTTNYHQLPPSLTTAITTSPYSRYSRLSSLVSQALARRQKGTLEQSESTCTISLPPLNPSAVTAILTFLEHGSLPSSSVSTFAKEDLLKAFDVLGVDFPPGFRENVNLIESEFGGSELDGRDYSRGMEDYTSPEVFEAMKAIRTDEGFTISFADSSEQQSPGHSTSANANAAVNTPTRNIIMGSSVSSPPPSYDYARSTTGASSYRMSSEDQKSAQPRFHAALQSTLIAKISSLLLGHVLPAIDTQTQLGLFKGTFILICDDAQEYSEIHAHQVTTSSRHDTIGGTDYRKVINLCSEGAGTTGPGFTQAFLTQDSVIVGIKTTLEQELGVPPEEEDEPEPALPPPPPPPPPPQAKKKSWFGLGKTQVQSQPALPPPPPAPVPKATKSRPRTGVDVKVEDVWVKAEIGGLWITASLKGVVVRIEFHLPQGA